MEFRHCRSYQKLVLKDNFYWLIPQTHPSYTRIFEPINLTQSCLLLVVIRVQILVLELSYPLPSYKATPSLLFSYFLPILNHLLHKASSLHHLNLRFIFLPWTPYLINSDRVSAATTHCSSSLLLYIQDETQISKQPNGGKQRVVGFK